MTEQATTAVQERKTLVAKARAAYELASAPHQAFLDVAYRQYRDVLTLAVDVGDPEAARAAKEIYDAAIPSHKKAVDAAWQDYINATR